MRAYQFFLFYKNDNFNIEFNLNWQRCINNFKFKSFTLMIFLKNIPIVRSTSLNKPSHPFQYNAPLQQLEKLGITAAISYPPYDTLLSSAHLSLTLIVLSGRPGTDYPVLGKVPYTQFYCDDQPYPGFFADVETRCQAWHYCDIDGRQATFLCPNGTQFSQAVFVCDWWFNVRCELSPKLYAINSRLYQRTTESPTRPHRVITKELLENIFTKKK